VNLNLLESTFPENLISVASKELRGKLSLLDAMFTKTGGRPKHNV
jgi:hypothetical protein